MAIAEKKAHMKRTSVPKFLDVPKANSKKSLLQNLLLHSPILSPSLPSILPRHGKKPPPLNTRRVLRWISWLFILTSVTYILSWTRPHKAHKPEKQIYHHDQDGTDYEIAENTGLPEYSTPLAVIDKEGQARWTIYIPSNRDFPLPTKEYHDICHHMDEIAGHVAMERGNVEEIAALHYYDHDPNYMDVARAQLTDLIPFDPAYKPGGDVPVCSSTMIYVLDAEDAGLGGSLLGLWLAYGLAQKEKRSFFMDDSHFTYGKYSKLLERPPAPNCRPPPPTHRVPCPPMSQHLVVSSATWEWTFGKAFHDKFSDKEVFEMMRLGYEALFKLLPEDQLFVASRVTELKQLVGPSNLLAGVHLRRGEKHPEEFAFSTGHTPVTHYLQRAQELVNAQTFISPSAVPPKNNSTIIIASDDISIYNDPTLFSQHNLIRAQNQITPPDLLAKGFFATLFWTLGLPESLLRQRKSQAHDSPLPNLDRERQQKILAEIGLEDKDVHRDYQSRPT
ncbi:hypothetical protein LTR66_017936, partial [Elasticomyces elasticus]